MFADFCDAHTIESYQDAAEAWLTESRKFAASRTVLRRAASLNQLAKMFELPIDLSDYRLPPTPPPAPHPLPGLSSDLDKMIDKADGNEQKALVGLGGLGGLRISETLTILPSDIDPVTKKMKILGKGDKLRYVPISTRLWNIILPLYIANKIANTPLVQMEDRNARAIITRIAKRCGIKDVSSHDLRATFATIIYNKTKDARLVQYLLGHTSLNTTQIYLGVDHEGAAEAVEFDD